MKQKLFWYAVIWHPTTQEAKEGKESRVVVKPDVDLANDEAEMRFKVTREIPEEDAKNPSQLEILIRPF